MGSWAEGRTVTKRCFAVVRENPYMLLFPVVAAVVSLVAVFIVAGIGLSILGIDQVEQQVTQAADGGDLSATTVVAGVVVLILAGYLATLIFQICMGGLVKVADEELQGRDSSFGAGISAALRRIGPLLGWAAIQTLVGWLLSAIRGNGTDGNVVITIVRMLAASLAAVAWALITFFVLPLIILRGKGPIEAIKESVKILKSTWGTQLAGGIRIGGLIFLLAVLPGILVLIVGIVTAIFAESAVIGIPIAAIGVIIIICAQVLVSALRAVFSVALLHYVEDGSAIGPFSTPELQSAVRVR
jgi:hypothetical protein